MKKLQRKRGREEEDDQGSMERLSKLPEDILNKILCFLPQKQAVRTCLLSRSWRYRGPTRSLLELSEITDFKGNNERFISVLDNSLQRYCDQNLCVKKLTLKMGDSNKLCHAKQLPLKMRDNTSLQCVLTSIALKAEFLVELCLDGIDLTSINFTPNFSLKNLRKLSLLRAYTANHALRMLLSRSCFPLIQYLNLNLIASTIIGINIASDLPTLETICIVNGYDWYFHNGYFLCLKCLNLKCTRLRADSFAFFASNYMPSLEELHLNRCKGFQEFRLSNHSIKYLHIIDLKELIKATIDAPNLVFLKLSLPICSQLKSLSLAPISTEWKSYIDVTFSVYGYSHAEVLQRNIALNELLKALSQSRITLKLIDPHRSFIKGPVTCIGFSKPLIVVDHFSLSGPYSYSNVELLFDSWFCAFRPRYIYDIHNQDMEVFESIWKVLVHDTNSCWNQDLVEVSVETSYGNPKEWHPYPFHGNPSFSKSALANNQRLRLRLKWRD